MTKQDKPIWMGTIKIACTLRKETNKPNSDWRKKYYCRYVPTAGVEDIKVGVADGSAVGFIRQIRRPFRQCRQPPIEILRLNNIRNQRITAVKY